MIVGVWIAVGWLVFMAGALLVFAGVSNAHRGRPRVCGARPELCLFECPRHGEHICIRGAGHHDTEKHRCGCGWLW